MGTLAGFAVNFINSKTGVLSPSSCLSPLSSGVFATTTIFLNLIFNKFSDKTEELNSLVAFGLSFGGAFYINPHLTLGIAAVSGTTTCTIFVIISLYKACSSAES